jgi:hypothetical protein
MEGSPTELTASKNLGLTRQLPEPLCSGNLDIPYCAERFKMNLILNLSFHSALFPLLSFFRALISMEYM